MRHITIAIAAGLAAGAPALAQDCPGVLDTAIGTPGATGGYMSALQPYDDGTGTALYGAGSFTNPAGRVAKWDGESWTSLGTGASNNFATCLGVWDGKLYMGGFFSSVGGVGGTANFAAWNGTEWAGAGANLGAGASIWSLEAFDDGNGERLYVGGNYLGIGGVSASRIAVYDGNSYEPLGTGLTGGVATIALDMTVWDDGSGPALFVVGRFDNAGPVLTPLVGKWNGTEWESVGGGLDGTQAVNVTVIDDELYVSGGTITPFATGIPCSVAKWDGENWTSLGDPLGNLVWSVFTFDAGDGEAIYAAGAYDDDTMSDLFYKWNGASWDEVSFEFNDSIFDTIQFDDGNGPATIIAGGFTSIDAESANSVTKLLPCETTCPADCNGDGALNILDFVCFQNEWQNQSPAGDCDDNGQYNILDFVCYQNLFSAGCE